MGKKLTTDQRQQIDALEREFKERKANILNPPKLKPPITTPINPAWTVELIHLLKKYIDANRYFRVHYQGQPIFGMDLVPEEYAGDFAPDGAEFYLREYDDNRPEGHLLSAVNPTDFQVYLLMPVKWQESEPNWNDADPESWAEYQRFQEATKEDSRP